LAAPHFRHDGGRAHISRAPARTGNHDRARGANPISPSVPIRPLPQSSKDSVAMASRLYVGNLPYNFTSQDLQQLFGAHGGVRSAEVIMDRMTGRSRGFGFVEMESDSASQA